MNYKQLCDTLGLEVKTGYAKQKQLEEIKLMCDLKITKNPTRYEIVQMYDKDVVEATRQIITSNKFQKEFDAAMFQKLSESAGQTLYLSNTELLMLFHEVNEKFKWTLSMAMIEAHEINKEYYYTSQIVYQILLLWTRRRLKSMEARNIIKTTQGYRVYKNIENPDGITYTIKYDVPEGSKLEAQCIVAWNKAVEDNFPKDWAEHRTWVHPALWRDYKRMFNDYFCELNKDYDSVQTVTIYHLPDEELFRQILGILYNKAPELSIINSEACRKLLTTSQLDMLTGEERKEYIETFIRR